MQSMVLNEDMVFAIADPIFETLRKARKKIRLELRSSTYPHIRRECTRLGLQLKEFHKLMQNSQDPLTEEEDNEHILLLRSLGYSVSSYRDGLKEAENNIRVAALSFPTKKSIEDDLIELATEFASNDPRYCPDSASGPIISITTDSIEFEGIRLGEFTVHLELDMIDNPGGGAYHVEALDPNPAVGDGSVTHPHVRDGDMCEGDGGAAISAALKQGRICDFFKMVFAVLYNYNQDGPYVSMDNWDGESCDNCGGYQNELYCCPECEHYLCDDCMTYCSECKTGICVECANSCDCGRTLCSNCLCSCSNIDCNSSVCNSCEIRCYHCDKVFCDDCVYKCVDCGEMFCADCSQECENCGERVCNACEEGGLCHSCKKALEEEEEDETSEPQIISGQSVLIDASPISENIDGDNFVCAKAKSQISIVP